MSSDIRDFNVSNAIVDKKSNMENIPTDHFMIATPNDGKVENYQLNLDNSIKHVYLTGE